VCLLWDPFQAIVLYSGYYLVVPSLLKEDFVAAMSSNYRINGRIFEFYGRILCIYGRILRCYGAILKRIFNLIEMSEKI
jgi:hypothetical protein